MENKTKITAFKVKKIPLSKVVDNKDYEVGVSVSNWDKNRYFVILKVANKVHDDLDKDGLVKVNLYYDESFANDNNYHTLVTFTMVAQIYDAEQDKIIDTKKQDYFLNERTKEFISYSPVPVNTVEGSIQGYWHKNKLVEKVEGPFSDADCKTIVSEVKIGTRYYFRATPKQKLHQSELLAMKWSYRYDDDEITSFNYALESVKGNTNIMSCIFHKQPKEIQVYAYYKQPSDKVSVIFYIFGNQSENVTITGTSEGTNCGQKFCIKKGDKNELIREINIRLAGFGGNVPTDEFTERTEKMIKQFQRDYMKVDETGKICGNVLTAIDEFQKKYSIDFQEIKCKCGTCSGFGDGDNKGKYLGQKKDEAHHRYEYPGIHRSLLSSVRSVKFYLAKDGRYSFNKINSGYRCRFHEEYLKKPTTNHMGKALDLHFNDKKGRTKKVSDMEAIRKDIFNKYMGAKWDWKSGQDNIFNLESTKVGAKTWVHYDVREFDAAYLKDEFFVKTAADLNKKSIVALAKELGFESTCNCSGFGTATSTDAANNNERMDPKSLKTSAKGIQFIKDWEKFEPKAYNDSEGYCTIGYGHLIDYNKCENISLPAEFKNGITEQKASELFKSRLVEFENSVKRDITAKLYQHEFDALVSLIFNTGPNFLNTGGAKKGPTKIKTKINSNDYSGGADEFSDVTNGGTAGLIVRRKAEINMFKNNIYDSTH